MGITELRTNGADLGRLKSDKQRLFVLEYLVDGQGKAAAVRAGYSEQTAHVTACKLLKNPIIKAYLGKTMRQDVERLELDRLEVLRQLWYALTRKVKDFSNPDGIPKLPEELPDECQSIVDGYKVKILKRWQEDGGETHCELVSVEYRLTPHAVAREQAMKHKGLFEPERMDVRLAAAVFDFDRLATGGEEPVDVVEAEIRKALPSLPEGNGKPKKGTSDAS